MPACRHLPVEQVRDAAACDIENGNRHTSLPPQRKRDNRGRIEGIGMVLRKIYFQRKQGLPAADLVRSFEPDEVYAVIPAHEINQAIVEPHAVGPAFAPGIEISRKNRRCWIGNIQGA